MAFPVDTNNYKFIEEICMKEGNLQFLGGESLPGLLGHVFYVKEIVVSVYSTDRRATLFSDALATDNVYQVEKGHGLSSTTGYLGISASSKQYKITSINTSNPAYDEITLSHTLGVALTTGDFLQMYTAYDRPVSYFIGMRINSTFEGDYNIFGGVRYQNSGTVANYPINKLTEVGENFFLRNNFPDSYSSNNISVTFIAYKVSADVNFNAKRVIYGFGDSIANLSGYVTRYNGHMWNIAKLEVNKSVARGGVNYDARLISDNMDGKTSTHLIDSLKQGRKLVGQVDLIMFMHGVNDASQGTTDLVWEENLQYMVDWRDTHYPNAKLLFLGATPVSSGLTTLNARLVELRQIQSDFVEANPNKNLYYFGMDTIVLPNYTASSTYFTDTVHPTQASQDLYGAGLGTYLKTIL